MLPTLQNKIEHPQVAKAPVKHAGSWLSFAAKILAWQLAAFFVVELSLSIAGLGEEEIFKLDPLLGFKHMSNKKVTWRSEGFASSYFNDDGLREHGLTVAKPAGTFRVALLGDSLAESLQVPLEESFGYQIQETLSKQVARPVQVIDFGTSGYSTVQEYLQLKQQVLKYKPDLVLLCYNSRDCFENWSPPDEVLTNVRPAALHLPGRKLIVDPSPVTQWMKTPRARFLKQVEPLRQYSRLWGLFSAAELDWSLHSEPYKRVLFFVTKPGKAIRKTISELSTYSKELGAKNGPTSNPSPTRKDEKTLPGVGAMPCIARAAHGAAPTRNPAQAQPTQVQPAQAQPTQVQPAQAQPTQVQPAQAQPTQVQPTQVQPAQAQPTQVQPAQAQPAQVQPAQVQPAQAQPLQVKPAQPLRSTYQQLIVRTLGSLIAEMSSISNKSGSQFAVVVLPVRSALSVRKGMETTFNDFDFNDEVKMLQDICKEKGIDLLNIHEEAKSLSAQDKDYLFYLVHLTPKGHEFVARQLAPKVKVYLTKGGSN